MKAILEGLQILIKYRPDGSFSAQHDEVFADGPKPEELPSEDAERLKELRWRWRHEYTSWAKFT